MRSAPQSRRLDRRTPKRSDPSTAGRVDLLLVCSSGGHLLQLYSLRAAWQNARRLWVSIDTSDVRSVLAGEEVVIAFSPTSRNVGNLVRNFGLAWRVVRRARPRVMVTTGAGVAVPFAYLARLYGAKIVYVESFTRIESASLSFRMIRPIADRIYVQWPELQRSIPSAIYVGSVFSDEALP